MILTAVACVTARQKERLRRRRTEIHGPTLYQCLRDTGSGAVLFSDVVAMTNASDYVPTWDGSSATLDAFEERSKMYVLGTKKDERYLCAPRLLARFDPDGDLYRTIKAVITDEQLMKEDGSGVSTMITILRGALGPKSMQEAVRLLLGFLKLQDWRAV